MADPVISVKLILLYRFLSHNFPRSKTMWFLANSSIWHRKMLLNLTIPHPTTSLNVFLSQFPSFSSYLEQRTVRNTRGPFFVMFSFMKYKIFVPKPQNIFSIIPGPTSTIVHEEENQTDSFLRRKPRKNICFLMILMPLTMKVSSYHLFGCNKAI